MRIDDNRDWDRLQQPASRLQIAAFLNFRDGHGIEPGHSTILLISLVTMLRETAKDAVESRS